MAFYRRFRSVDGLAIRSVGEGAAAKNIIEIRASTDEPVSMGNWSEVLVHDGKMVDASAARAMLINHDPNQIAGSLEGEPEFAGGGCNVRAAILPDARMQSGVRVADGVSSGALRGVSIGYGYSMKDTSWDEKTRTLTVKKWTLREVSLTPIPADPGAHVRSLPDEISQLNKRDAMTDPIKPDNAADVEAARVATRAEAKEVAAMARSVGLNADDFVGMSKVDAQAAMIAARAAADKAKVPDPVAAPTPVARVGEEQTEKHRDAVCNAMMARAGFTVDLKGNPYAGMSMMDMGRKYARSNGVRGADDWSRKENAHYCLGETDQIAGFRDAANISSGSFSSFVTLNAITKIVAKGFELGSSSIRYQRVVSTQRVPDFKSYSIGGLATGNLQQTAENIAFPELVKSEGVFSNVASMWGGTLSVTLQALINDDTAQFDRSLRMSGVIAQKTIDRRVFQKLLNGTATTTTLSTWTSNTTSGGSLVYTTADLAAAARGRVALVRAALMNKVGLDGNPMGTHPKFLICGPTREVEAQGIIGPVSPGQIGAFGAVTSQPSINGMEVIATPWLEASALVGNSTTTYYLLADPNEVTGLVLSFINGYDSPQVQEYDAGAVGARKWKVWLPFEVDLFNITVSGTATIPAAQQGTT